MQIRNIYIFSNEHIHVYMRSADDWATKHTKKATKIKPGKSDCAVSTVDKYFYEVY